MKTLKFRRWDKINKIMLAHEKIPVLLKNARDDNQFSYMQWTGLSDKGGKDIYEGDILLFDPIWEVQYDGKEASVEHQYVVKWERELCGFEPFVDYDDDCDQYNSSGNCVVQGNIHENPELLGDKP